MDPHVPRPKNAFILFRTDFVKDRMGNVVERDMRHISRIAGFAWRTLSDAEKEHWRQRADDEKARHGKEHPGYKFSPSKRSPRPKQRRNVRRNGEDEIARCKALADLVLAGKEGSSLVDAVRAANISVAQPTTPKRRRTSPDSFEDSPSRPPRLDTMPAFVSDERFHATPTRFDASDSMHQYDMQQAQWIFRPALTDYLWQPSPHPTICVSPEPVIFVVPSAYATLTR